ncbi:ferritin-like domain-containing protein [Desulfallas thermosapovorans]|uniref:Rubrerythrin n=1 Tax=Desulfallas thermosapovorans DSM 6562 TaxID=1121431 RepID=A0A5S4ZPU3_9FIRM|nr:ferritin family protein [Desulfallas thermosapovorans]TYO94737.1 rubrerythrin [Desulfallas thermosapovorans DSM 6562]
MAWSITNFSGEEIVRLAVTIEKQGQKFYEIAAGKVDDPEIKGIFEYLAGEEKQHISDFESLGAKLSNDFTPNESYVGEYSDYIKALIDNHVFNHDNIDKLIDGITVTREALAIALRFEKDSILIFQELYNVVDDSGREIIGKLINQEKQHIRKLATDVVPYN